MEKQNYEEPILELHELTASCLDASDEGTTLPEIPFM